MRRVLQTFAKQRGLRVQLCYGDNCVDPITNFLLGEATGALAGTLVNSLSADKCVVDKIIYGHGVYGNVAATLQLPEAGAAWIAMVREPMPWAVSQYKEAFGTKQFGGSFDAWVQTGKAAITWVNHILHCAPDAETMVQKWNEWVEQKHPLILFTEEYEASVSKLADFVGATPETKQQMLAAISRANTRSASTYAVTLSQDSVLKLQKMLEPTQQIYNDLLSKSETQKTKSSWQMDAVEGESGMVRITISTDLEDDDL